MRILTIGLDKPIKFSTPGREQLRSLGLGPTEISRAMGPNARGKYLSPSQVSRWLAGDGRPDDTHKPVIKRLWGIEESAWLTSAERADLEARIASTCAAPTGTDS